MLANGSMPMLSTAAPADSRLATAGDMLSLPDDRRNLAPASSSPAAVTAGNEAHESPPSTITSITSAAETEEPQQDGGRTASPAPPPPPPPRPTIAARKEEGGPPLCSAAQSPPPCALDPRSSERKTTWEGGGSSSSSTNYYCNNNRGSSDAVKASVVNEPNANVVAPPRAAEVIAPSTEHASCVSSEVVPPLPQQQQQQQLRKQPTPPNVPRPAKSNSSVAGAGKDSITTHVPNATTTIAATTDSDETSGPPLPQPAVSTATAVAVTPANTTSGAPTPAAASSIVNGNGARQDSKMGPTSTHVEKVQIDSPLAGQHDVVDKSNGGGDHIGMEVDEEGPREHVPRGAAVAPSSLLLVAGANNVVSSATAQGCAEKGGAHAMAAQHETDADKVEVCRQRLERLASGGVGPAAAAAAAAAAASGDDVVDMRVVKREESVQHEQVSAEMQALNASFPPRNSVLEDAPLGEGWDDQGRDLSKASNDAIRRAQCEAWTAKLRQEASLIRAGDHPEVVRRSVLTDMSSKRRLDMSERNAKRQRSTVERLYQLEMQSIKASYDAAVAQTRERLTVEVNEELRRSKSRMEGFKEVENRMNTRHTRGTAKGSIEDPWLPQATGAKSNGNSKRPLCPVALVLEDDALAEDIEFLRYAPHGNNGGGGAGSGYNGGYGDSMPQGVSGRSRRPPAWRRDD